MNENENMMFQKNVDMLFVSVPLVYPYCPPIGIAILKSQLRKYDWSCDSLDLNIELYQQPKLKYLFEIGHELFSFYPPQKNNYEKFLDIYNNELKEFFIEWSKKLIAANPKNIGLSLFSNHSAYFAERLIHELRNLNPEISIVIGGPYATTLVTRKADREFFPKDINIITGDAELSIIEFLEGNLDYGGINSPATQLQNLDIIPIPDYEQRQFEVYDTIDGTKRSYVTTSRGCVRRCSFCDIKNLWPKYKYRSPEKVFNELKHLHDEFGRDNIIFTDSLVNGNVNALKELCQLIVKNKLSIKWVGQFICRHDRVMPPSIFQLLADSGCHQLSIGIESGSERVREDMRKHFSNEEIFYNLKELTRVGIDANLLMIFGYVTEDEKAFQETLDFFDQCIEMGVVKSNDNPKGAVSRITLGFTMGVLPDTEAEDVLHSLNPTSPIGFDWNIKGNDRFIRLERLFRAITHLHRKNHLHVIGSNIGAQYNNLWDEFKTYNKFEKVDFDLINKLTKTFAKNSA